MKRTIPLLAVLIGLSWVALILIRRSSDETSHQAAARQAPIITPTPAPGAVAMVPPVEDKLQNTPPHPLAASFGENPELAAKEPAMLLEILEFYRMEFGTFPAGQENRDIMHALQGNNPDKLPLFPIKHPRINAAGELLDAWGQPFVFHPLSSQSLEVRSCGPDGEMFTPDDIVVPPLRPSGLESR